MAMMREATASSTNRPQSPDPINRDLQGLQKFALLRRKEQS